MFANIIGIPRNWLLLFQKSQTRFARWSLIALLEIQISDLILVLDFWRFEKSGWPCKLDEEHAV